MDSWPASRFRELIQQILDQTEMTYSQLAGLVGIHPSQLSRWANGRIRPSFDTLRNLGEALQRHYPQLKIGPQELLTAAGYTADQGALLERAEIAQVPSGEFLGALHKALAEQRSQIEAIAQRLAEENARLDGMIGRIERLMAQQQAQQQEHRDIA